MIKYFCDEAVFTPLSLEKKTGVCKTDLEARRPADRSALLAWEQVCHILLGSLVYSLPTSVIC